MAIKSGKVGDSDGGKADPKLLRLAPTPSELEDAASETPNAAASESPPPPLWGSCRLTVTAYCSTGLTILLLMRFGFSMSMVCMARSDGGERAESRAAAPTYGAIGTGRTGEFAWERKEQQVQYKQTKSVS